MKTCLWVTAFALLATGCAHERRPHISYFCQALLTNENGEFRANPNEVEWKYDLGDGAWAFLGLPHAWQSADSFRAHGFDDTREFPALVIRFDHRFGRNAWMRQPPDLRVAGQIGVGARSQSMWVS